jgi:hypothetical protein
VSLLLSTWVAVAAGGLSLGANELRTSAKNAREGSNKTVKDNKEAK